jgi:hypothetical protein
MIVPSDNTIDSVPSDSTVLPIPDCTEPAQSASLQSIQVPTRLSNTESEQFTRMNFLLRTKAVKDSFRARDFKLFKDIGLHFSDHSNKDSFKCINKDSFK